MGSLVVNHDISGASEVDIPGHCIKLYVIKRNCVVGRETVHIDSLMQHYGISTSEAQAYHHFAPNYQCERLD